MRGRKYSVGAKSPLVGLSVARVEYQRTNIDFQSGVAIANGTFNQL